jgi:hypothetical protein
MVGAFAMSAQSQMAGANGTVEFKPLISSLFPENLVQISSASWAQKILDAFPLPAQAFGFECPLLNTETDFAILVPQKALDFQPHIRNRIGSTWFSYESCRPNFSGPGGIHIGSRMDGRAQGFEPRLLVAIWGAIDVLASRHGIKEGDSIFPVQLERALIAIPKGASVWNVSRIFSRPGRPWKINITVPKYELGDFLENLGWIGNQEKLWEILECSFEEEDSVRLDLSFSPTLSPRIGIEVFAGQDRFSPVKRTTILDWITGVGICSYDKRKAIESWRGLGLAWKVPSSKPLMFIKNWYLKIIIEQGGSIHAKAYIYCRPESLVTR